MTPAHHCRTVQWQRTGKLQIWFNSLGSEKWKQTCILFQNIKLMHIHKMQNKKEKIKPCIMLATTQMCLLFCNINCHSYFYPCIYIFAFYTVWPELDHILCTSLKIFLFHLAASSKHISLSINLPIQHHLHGCLEFPAVCVSPLIQWLSSSMFSRLLPSLLYMSSATLFDCAVWLYFCLLSCAVLIADTVS